jgi:hypothetical protein
MAEVLARGSRAAVTTTTMGEQQHCAEVDSASWCLLLRLSCLMKRQQQKERRCRGH